MTSKHDDIPNLSDYAFFTPLQTRWSDNDMYGHLNNVIYNRLFELTTVKFYIETKAQIFGRSPDIRPMMAEVLVRFRSSLSFPDDLIGAMSIGYVSDKSVRYEIALFRKGEQKAAAHGHIVHVFVDIETQTPASIPDDFRALFARFQAGAEASSHEDQSRIA